MVSNLNLTAVSQFSSRGSSMMEARRGASYLYSKVLSRARRRNLLHKLTHRENQLQDLSAISSDAKRQPPESVGIVSVPLSKIIGSEGRVQDFDNAFNPLKAHNRDRWIGIAAARQKGTSLPPVDLIQAGHQYYVRDGHHRISVAKAFGQAEIEAQIVYVLAN